MTIRVWYRDDYEDGFVSGDCTYMRSFKNARGIVVGCNCITIYIGDETINIPFEDIKQFTVKLK